MVNVRGFSKHETANGVRLRVLAQLQIGKVKEKTIKGISLGARKEKGTVSNAISHLKAKGFVTVLSHKGRRGGSLYSITESGLGLLDEIRAQCIGGVRDWARILLDRWPW